MQNNHRKKRRRRNRVKDDNHVFDIDYSEPDPPGIITLKRTAKRNHDDIIEIDNSKQDPAGVIRLKKTPKGQPRRANNFNRRNFKGVRKTGRRSIPSPSDHWGEDFSYVSENDDKQPLSDIEQENHPVAKRVKKSPSEILRHQEASVTHPSIVNLHKYVHFGTAIEEALKKYDRGRSNYLAFTSKDQYVGNTVKEENDFHRPHIPQFTPEDAREKFEKNIERKYKYTPPNLTGYERKIMTFSNIKELVGDQENFNYLNQNLFIPLKLGLYRKNGLRGVADYPQFLFYFNTEGHEKHAWSNPKQGVLLFYQAMPRLAYNKVELLEHPFFKTVQAYNIFSERVNATARYKGKHSSHNTMENNLEKKFYEHSDINKLHKLIGLSNDGFKNYLQYLEDKDVSFIQRSNLTHGVAAEEQIEAINDIRNAIKYSSNRQIGLANAYYRN